MFRKVLGILWLLSSYICVNAAQFVVKEVGGQLQYVNSESKSPVALGDVLLKYKYAGKPLPQTDADLAPYVKMYSPDNEYLLQCDSNFLAPIKAIIWEIKFSIIQDGKYPTDAIGRLNVFCELIKLEEATLGFKNFLIKVLFQQNGLKNLYSEIKEYEAKFKKEFFSGSLRKNLNEMLDIVDPKEQIERFKK
jgi:hypothetical protein